MSPTPPETSPPRDLSELVVAVFERWRRDGIEFLVLRNYEGLPRETTNDIDVLVLPGRLATAERALREAAAQAGYVLHNRAEFSPVSLFFHHPATRQQIQFDLFHGLNWRGFALLPPRAVLERRIDRGLFAIPHPAHEAVINLLTRQIYHGYVKEKYKPAILAGFQQDTAEAVRLLADMFGDGTARALSDDILAGRWADVERRTGTMRRQLVWRRLTRHPFATLGSLLSDLRRFAGRLWRPPGITVILLGADGCGKSTVAGRLTAGLTNTFKPDKSLMGHWKPRVFSRGRDTGVPVTDPHGRPPRGRVASLVMLGAHWLEFLAGAGVRFFPVLFRNGLVLMDRYHYDFIVDPRRYRLQVSGGLVRALFRLMPSPDRVFLLDAPTAVLRSRKQEVPEAETRRQQDAFRAVVAGLRQAKVVDCSRPPEAVAGEIEDDILRYLAARQLERMR